MKEVSNQASELKAQNSQLIAENDSLYEKVNDLTLKCREYNQLKQSYDDLMCLHNNLDSNHRLMQVEMGQLKQELNVFRVDNERLKVENATFLSLNLEYKDTLELSERQRRKLHNDVLDLKGMFFRQFFNVFLKKNIRNGAINVLINRQYSCILSSKTCFGY